MSLVKYIKCPDCLGAGNKNYHTVNITIYNIECRQCDGQGFVLTFRFWKGKEVKSENIKLCKSNMLINYKEKIKNADFIGITGFAQSGKDEVGKILNIIGFQRVSLADPVRQGTYNINPIVLVEDEFHYLLKDTKSLTNNPSMLFYRLRDIVDNIGWDDAKKIPEIRRLLQFYGTEGARDIFGETIWTDIADKYIKKNNIRKVVVTDIRFQNELKWIRSKKNELVIKIKRTGIKSVNNHLSDVGINDDSCDIIIQNDGNLNELKNNLIND